MPDHAEAPAAEGDHQRVRPEGEVPGRGPVAKERRGPVARSPQRRGQVWEKDDRAEGGDRPAHPRSSATSRQPEGGHDRHRQPGEQHEPRRKGRLQQPGLRGERPGERNGFGTTDVKRGSERKQHDDPRGCQQHPTGHRSPLGGAEPGHDQQQRPQVRPFLGEPRGERRGPGGEHVVPDERGPRGEEEVQQIRGVRGRPPCPNRKRALEEIEEVRADHGSGDDVGREDPRGQRDDISPAGPSEPHGQQQGDPSEQGRGEEDLGGKGEQEHQHPAQCGGERQRAELALQAQHDQQHGQGHGKDQREVQVSGHLGQLVGREPEEVAPQDRGPEAVGHLATQQERGPPRQRGRGQHQEVVGDHGPPQRGEGGHQEAGPRDGCGPGHVEAPRGPDQVRDERVQAVAEGVRPPVEEPDLRAGVRVPAGHLPGGQADVGVGQVSEQGRREESEGDRCVHKQRPPGLPGQPTRRARSRLPSGPLAGGEVRSGRRGRHGITRILCSPRAQGAGSASSWLEPRVRAVVMREPFVGLDEALPQRNPGTPSQRGHHGHVQELARRAVRHLRVEDQ